MKYNTERDARLATEKMKRIVPCSTRTLIWSFVRERSAPCHSGPTRLGRFLFSARCCSGASTSTHAAHAHRTTWRRFSTSATVRTRSRTRGARVSLGTRPQRRSTETLLDSFSSSSHRATASDHFPPTRPPQLPRCTWPRRPLSAWASASSPVPSGRYASRHAEPEPRRAIAGPRHPAAPPPETEKYPQHGDEPRFSFDIRTIFISADPTPRSSPRRTGTGRPSAMWRRSTPRASERSGRRFLCASEATERRRKRLSPRRRRRE